MRALLCGHASEVSRHGRPVDPPVQVIDRTARFSSSDLPSGGAIRLNYRTRCKLRDQFLGEAKRSLNLILATIRIHVEALKNTVEPVRGETAAGVSAKLTTLEWGLDRLSNIEVHAMSSTIPR